MTFQTFTNDALDVHHTTLPNGLQVYLTKNSAQPVFYAEIIIRVGGRHDPSDCTGMAHYLEHMLFKGSQNLGTTDYVREKAHLGEIISLYQAHSAASSDDERKVIYDKISEVSLKAAEYAVPNELDTLYQSLGAEHLNAHTGYEETVYKVQLPNNCVEQWAKIESDRFSRPVFRLFQSELETVYEEKNRSLDDKDSVLTEAVNQALFPGHPYGEQTILGSSEHLKRPSLKRLYEFYHTYYVPNNMAIVISGDIDFEQTLAVIKHYFSSWQATPLPELAKHQFKKLDLEQVVEVEHLGEESVVVAYPTVAKNHQDESALRVMDMLLDNAQAGLINLNLNQAQRVKYAGCYPWFLQEHGSLRLWGVPKAEQSLTDVRDKLIEQVNLIKQGEFSENLLQAVINDFEKYDAYDLEHNSSRVSMIRKSFVAGQSWAQRLAEHDTVLAVTHSDVVRVANQYCQSGFVTAYRYNRHAEMEMIPKPDFPSLTIDRKRQSTFAGEVRAMPTSAITPKVVDFEKDFERSELGDGVSIYSTRNPFNALFELNIVISKGFMHDKTLVLTKDFIDKCGTKTLPADTLQRKLYELGCTTKIKIERYRVVIELEGLERNFTEALALFFAWVHEPVLHDDKAFDDLIEVEKTKRADSKKNLRSIDAAVLDYALYDKFSYYLSVLPNNTLEKLTSDELLSTWRALIRTACKINFVGNLTHAEVVEQVTAQLPDDKRTALEPWYPDVRKPEKPTLYFYHHETKQANIRFFFAGEHYDPAKQIGYLLYNEYFDGGMGSIVFQEIREARALAYSASASFSLGQHQKQENIFLGSIGTQVDKTQMAIDVLHDILYSLPRSDESFAYAKQALLHRYETLRVDFRELLTVVQSWQKLGFINEDPRTERYREAKTASWETLEKFTQTKIADNSLSLTLVGDESQLDLKALSEKFVLYRLTERDIFAY